MAPTRSGISTLTAPISGASGDAAPGPGSSKAWGVSCALVTRWPSMTIAMGGTVPAGFRATEVGPDYCLGMETDADGVERIVMYGLIRV